MSTQFEDDIFNDFLNNFGINKDFVDEISTEAAIKAQQSIQQANTQQEQSFFEKVFSSISGGVKSGAEAAIDIATTLAPLVKTTAEIAPAIVELVRTIQAPDTAALQQQTTNDLKQQLELTKFALQAQGVQNQQTLQQLQNAQQVINDEIEKRNRNKILIGGGIAATGIIVILGFFALRRR